MSNPLIIRGMDYYCPECKREMYALSVSDLITNGGKCPWCACDIRKGETIEWNTLDGKHLLVSEMTTQHISNIIDMFEVRNEQTLVPLAITEILVNELKFRGDERLPYKPYYDPIIESGIRG